MKKIAYGFISFCLLSHVLLAQDYYPLCAFHVKDTLWFKAAGKDSLGLNMIDYEEQVDSATQRKILDAANRESLKVILRHATKSSQGGMSRNDIEWYCRLHSGQWEAESSCFYHGVGELVADPQAPSNHYAWKATIGAGADTMLKGPDDRFRNHEYSKWIDAVFYLKVDSLGLDTVRVCSLCVTMHDNIIVAQRVLRVSNFDSINFYQPCTLSANCSYDASVLNYWIYWYGNRSLWCDQVVSKDRYIDLLRAGDYNGDLWDITSIFNDNTALDYYYLLDEPYISYFAANAYVMRYLNLSAPTPRKQGIQTAWNYINSPTFYQMYVDSVKPNVLMFNCFPLNKDVPLESDSLFQRALDKLCTEASRARLAAMSCEPDIPFWYVCQSVGQYYDAGGYIWLREPTPRELKCMIWLALAYGAKGINHFLYPSIKENPLNNWADSGLVDTTVCPPRHRDSLWIPAHQMHFTLKEIGSQLLNLTSNTVFKSSSIPENNCNISFVSDSLMQVGTFFKTGDQNEKYFIVVNRHCLPSESLEVLVGINNPDSLFLWDCYTEQAIAPAIMIGPPPPPFYFNIKLKPGEGRLLRLVPFTPGFKINAGQTYTNMFHVALTTKSWSSESIDSMRICQIYDDSLQDETAWLPYDTTYYWRMMEGQGTNTVSIKYKVDGNIISPQYHDDIVYDITLPTGSFVINNNDTFTNTASVALKASCTDQHSNMSKMRYGNQYLKNVVKNSAFDDSTQWQKNTGIYDSNLKLYKIPVITSENYFYQAIPDDSLAQYDNDTMLLWLDLVSDSFVGTGKVKFQYVYTCKSDTVITTGASISIPQGTNASVSHYNLNTYFKYHPTPSADQLFIEGRVGVFIDASAGNKGKLYIDNLKTDVVSPYNSFSRFETYDSLKSWTLTSGNGARKVYGQFSDGAGNETDVTFDTIIADTTKPARKISSPTNNQIINGDSVEIKGWAYDYADPQQHFKQYELTYQKIDDPGQTWYGVYPDSLKLIPVNQSFPPRRLGYWNTDTVTARQGDGSYKLRLTVRDSALNYRDTTINVYIDNSGGEDEMIGGFSNYVYGASAGSEVYVGEFTTGKIYRYNESYQLIDTFKLIDSLGNGNPIAMINDDSGKIWIANIKSHTINRFSHQGNFEYRFSGNLSLPSGIVFDDGGNIWVSDRMHNKIRKFSPIGDSLFAFGEKGSAPGKINEPLGIDIFEHDLYIVDSKNKRISVFDTLGNFIEILADSAGLSLPFAIVIDSTGCFTVSDFQANKVIEFDPWGSPLFTIDSLLDSPSGLALSQDEERIYISDTKHKRVLVYVLRSDSTSGGGPQSNSSGNIFKPMLQVMPTLVLNNTMIKIQGMKGQRVDLKVYDPTGRLVKTLWNNVVTIPNQCITWDGRDSNNRALGEGVYFIMLDAPELKQTRKIVLVK